ncbi:MAG: hypothetical protein K0R39_2529 [Symbiobacteriaceae bacterium]|nr:hypothetical protein [Symbiobacteriaceae bacterium]
MGGTGAVPYRHRLFGVAEPSLRRMLLHRRRAHRAAIAPLRHELVRQRRHSAELGAYLALLGAEVLALEEEERALSRQLSPTPTPSPADENDPLEAQRRTLHQYRALQTHLVTSVLALIAPFLGTAGAQQPKEAPTWPTIHSESGSGSVGP